MPSPSSGPLSGHREAVALPVAFSCLSYAAFCVTDATVKGLHGGLPLAQIICIYALFSLPVLGAWAFVHEGRRGFRTGNWPMQFLRSLMSQGTVICNVTALPHVGLASFYTIIFAAPFMVALFSALFLKERLDRGRLAAILAGFAVVLFVFLPEAGTGAGRWHALVLFSAAFYALQLVTVRKLLSGGTGESRAFMFIFGSCLTVLWSLPLTAAHFVPPLPQQWALMGAGALAATLGLLSMSRAMETASSAAMLAPCHYTQIVWGALIGYLAFGEMPAPRMLAGAGLIIALGLFLALREGRRARKAKAATPLPTPPLC